METIQVDQTRLTFLAACHQLFANPKKLFEKVNSSPTAVKDSVKIAAIALGLEFALRFAHAYWFGETLSNPGAAMKGGLSAVLVSLMLLPLRTILFHGVSFMLGGKGSLAKAFSASCVLEILGVIYHALDSIPKAGVYLSALAALYWPVAIAIAAVCLYKVKPAFSYGFAALVCIFTFGSVAIRTSPEVAKMVFGHDSAMLDALRHNDNVHQDLGIKTTQPSQQEERYPAMEDKDKDKDKN